MPVSAKSLCIALENIFVEMKQQNILQDFKIQYKITQPDPTVASGVVNEAILQLQELAQNELATSGNPVQQLYKQDVEKGIVQIRASKKDMEARIDSFLQRKRTEVNEWNAREFCNRSYSPDEDDSLADDTPDSHCARVDSVLSRCTDSNKSHIRLSTNVEHWKLRSKLSANNSDILIKLEPGTPIKPEQQLLTNDSPVLRETIEERLVNMETHLNIRSDARDFPDIFQRLKSLEDRILELESTSPEYFNYQTAINDDRQQYKRKYEEMSNSALNSRIKALKEELTKKQKSH